MLMMKERKIMRQKKTLTLKPKKEMMRMVMKMVKARKVRKVRQMETRVVVRSLVVNLILNSTRILN